MMDIEVCSIRVFQVKIEKYYVPMFEVFVRMPSFHFETDSYIEANVWSEYTFDKVKHMLKYRNVTKMFNRKDLVMPWSDGMPRILIIAHLSSMTQATTDKSMHTTKTSQTHTEAPSMTPSKFSLF